MEENRNNEKTFLIYGKKSIITQEEIELTAKMQIVSAICHNVDWKDCFKKCKKRQECDARVYVWYILHKEYGFSMNKLAFLYERTQRSINRGISCISYLIKRQVPYKKRYYKIKDKLEKDISRNELQEAINILHNRQNDITLRCA